MKPTFYLSLFFALIAATDSRAAEGCVHSVDKFAAKVERFRLKTEDVNRGDTLPEVTLVYSENRQLVRRAYPVCAFVLSRPTKDIFLSLLNPTEDGANRQVGLCLGAKPCIISVAN